MVNIFDLHADIGYDINIKKKKGVEHPFLLHQDKLLSGGIHYVAVACFFRGNETWEEMQETIVTVQEELMQSDVIFVSGCGHPTGDGIYVFLSVEGLGGIHEDVTSKIKWLADHEVRMASLTWNGGNALATGVGGDVCRGITKLGEEALVAMKEFGIVLDVSHLNEMSFWDAIRLHEGKLMATHSNARNLCWNDRNLTNEQIRAIACRNGLIGLTAVKYFVSCNPEKQTAHQMALHAKHMKEVAGIQALAIGFDYMDYYEDDNNDLMVVDLPDASYSQNFIEALKEVGFSDLEINQIAHRNVLNFFHRPRG